ncbi:MAG TPA: M48 family metalloprotease, partial [Candidatus Ozemobacteraceae bacterium]|nr:M48 family metalloprotease [Candidatus Ozemobacteraceae bacterium]
VFIYRGMLDFCRSDDELATILAHELAHSERRHSLKQLRGNAAFALLLQAAVKNKKDQQTWGAVVGALTSLAFSREHEDEADDLGQTRMFQAGFDPSAQVLVWEKFVQKFGKGPGGIMQYLSTHPPSQDRVANARKNLTKFQVPERKDFTLSFNVTAETEENLIQNGSFETDVGKRGFPDAWEKREGQVAPDGATSYTGKASLSVAATSNVRPARVVSELIPVNPAGSYELSGFGRAQSAANKVSIGAEIYDKNKRLRGYIWPVLSNGQFGTDWQTFSGTFAPGKEPGKSLPPDTAFIRILLQSGPFSQGNIWFDHLVLKPAGSKPSDNLIPDGNFEFSGADGQLRGVLATPGAVSQDKEFCKVGYASLKMTGNGGETAMMLDPLMVEQFKPGQELRLAMHYCGSAEFKFRAMLELVDAAGKPLARRLVEKELTAKPNLWQAEGIRVRFELQEAEKGVARALVVKVVGTIPAGSHLWLDGFTLR